MELTIRTEFGEIEITRDTTANGPRFRIEDLRGGKVAYVSPIELESLVWCDEPTREQLVQNAMRQW